jgi:hypothetical protein
MPYLGKRPPIVYRDTNTPQQTAILRLLAHQRHVRPADAAWVAKIDIVHPQLTGHEAARLAGLVRDLLGDARLAAAVELGSEQGAP